MLFVLVPAVVFPAVVVPVSTLVISILIADDVVIITVPVDLNFNFHRICPGT